MHTPLTRFLTRRRFGAALPFVQGSVLDLGCGAAEIVGLLPSGTRYQGVDSHPEVIRWLKETRPDLDLVLARVDQEALPTQERFDTVLMLALIEHLTDPMHAIALAEQHTKPAGSLVLTTPTELGLKVHRLLAGMGLVSHYAAEEHQRAYSRSDLAQILTPNRLRITHYRKFLLGGNQLIVCQHA